MSKIANLYYIRKMYYMTCSIKFNIALMNVPKLKYTADQFKSIDSFNKKKKKLKKSDNKYLPIAKYEMLTGIL